jgi:acyl carrier protein
MAAGERAGEALSRRGLQCIEPALALEALERALLTEETCTAIADIRWDIYAPLYASARPRPLIEDLSEARAALGARGESDETTARALGERLAQASPRERPALVLGLVRTEVAHVLGQASPEAVDPRRAFKELGFDSLTAVELRNRLEGVTGLGLEATLLFDYPSPAVLAEHLLAELTGGEPSAGEDAEFEFANLERALTSLDDGAERSGMTARLRALLAGLESQDQSVLSSNARSAVAVTDRVQTASDEEIFDFIDREFGSS